MVNSGHKIDSAATPVRLQSKLCAEEKGWRTFRGFIHFSSIFLFFTRENRVRSGSGSVSIFYNLSNQT
jgi:hypothetical protein